MKKYHLRGNEERNILGEITRRNANWICSILRMNCLIIPIIERTMEKSRGDGKTRKKMYAATGN